MTTAVFDTLKASRKLKAAGIDVWNPRCPDEPVLWESTIELGQDFFNEIIRHRCRST